MCSKKCADIVGLIFQIIVLIALVVYILSLVIGFGVTSNIFLIIFIFCYVAYLIAEFKSPFVGFLSKRTNVNGIQNDLSIAIQTPPEIEFYCKCYHNKFRKKSYHKVVTWEETVTFPYYSARDVSGLFELKNSREEAMGKTYIKLELITEINFADNLSYMDYEDFRTDFYNRNISRDEYMEYYEKRSIPGLIDYNLVCIRDEEPCCINAALYVILTIIPFVELYKCYINSYCVEQKFTIRKLISTRYDLNQNQQYQLFTPSINVPNQQYVFEPNNYNYINNQYPVQTPTQEEINRAAQYNNKIPNYQCVSYTSLNDGQIKVGVVQDDPAYCSVNISYDIPPNCQNKDTQKNSNNMNMNMNNMNMNMNMNMNNMNMNTNRNLILNANQGGFNNNMNDNMNYYNSNMNINNTKNNMNNDEEDESEENGVTMGYSGS